MVKMREKMIDSILYGELPLKLNRSVNMARLENETYEDIVAHLDRELEPNALEESDDLSMAAAGNRNLLSNGIDTNTDAQCFYCKATDHFF